MKGFMRLSSVMVAMIIGTSTLAHADDGFPNKPIKIIVGFAAGGPSDVIARLLAPEMQNALGQPVIVENRPGASGVIASNQVAVAAADGYTLYLAPNTHLINHVMNPSVRFHPVKDFTPISLLTTTPNMLIVNVTTPFKTVADFVSEAKSKPGQISYATSGIGTNVHFAGEQLAYEANIRLNHVPFKGGNQSIEAVAAGHVPTSISALSSSLPWINAGKVRVVAVMSKRRSTLLPDVPTFAEAGYDGIISETWLGLIGPKGIPRSVTKRLSEAISEILANPKFRAKVLNTGSEVVDISLEEFGARMETEYEGYRRVAEVAEIKAQ